MKSDEIAVQTRGLTKDYGHRRILRQIDADLRAGELVALMGANGAGKTTLLGCLATIIRPTAGHVYWFGQAATGQPARRRWIGMLAHESRLYPQLSLEENLIFAARMAGMGQPRQRADRQLQAIGLAPHRARLPAEVSRGMRQRVAVARALIHEPRIVLLDEPYTGLDVNAVAWLSGVLEQLRQSECAVCFTTHDREQAVRLADRIWELEDGRLNEVSTTRAAVSRDARQQVEAA